MGKQMRGSKSERIGLSYVIGEGPSVATEIIDTAVLAEKCGFYSVFMPEHYYDREAGSILGAIARLTSSIRLSTGVINPFTRYPSLIAMTIATLDELSGGRAFLGLGSGGLVGSLKHGIPNEFKNQESNHPVGHLREIVTIVRRLFRNESVTFDGEFYSLDNVKLHFKPVQKNIPIYFGQQGPKMMELAGQIADGVIITLCCTVPYVKDVVARVGASEKASGRKRGSVDFAARVITSLAEDRSRAIRQAKPLVGGVFIHPGARPVMEITDIKLDIQAIKNAMDRGKRELVYDLVPDEVVELTTASGTKADIRRRVEEYRDAGSTHPLIVPIGKNAPEIIRCLAS